MASVRLVLLAALTLAELLVECGLLSNTQDRIHDAQLIFGR